MAVDRRILPRAAIVSSCTLLSRVLGLARDVLTAGIFGTGAAWDMFVLAFTVPNLLRKLFGEGALNSAFIPVLSQEIADSEQDERLLFRATLTALASLLGVLTLAGWGICAATLLLDAQISTFSLGENWRLFFILLAIMIPYMQFICMTALLGAALNTRKHFFAPAVAPALLNICWIATVLICGNRYGVQALAWGVLVGGACQFLLQIPFLIKQGWNLRPLWNLAHPGLRRMAALILPVVFGLGVIQLNVALDRLIAEFCVAGAGANSALFYGNRLLQFPLGVLGIALATAVFPSLAQHAADKEHASLVATANMSIRTACFIALPCTAVVMALSIPLVRVMFERGEFTTESTARTAAVLFYYGLGLAAFCVIHVLARTFHALQDTRTPVKIAMSMVGLNLALNLMLVWPMREAGLALASSISAVGNVALLFIHLRKRLGPMGGRRILLSCMRTGLAAAVAVPAGYFAHKGLTDALGSERFATQALTLAGGMAGAGVVFLIAAWVLRVSELRELADAFRRKRKKAHAG
jgi:putative peptidoglycan lipid II flippase